MQIIYNPSDGAPIKDFIYKGDLLDTLYPDGCATPQGTIANGLMQYEDEVANYLLETFGFLETVSEERANKLLEKPKEEFKCDFPGCNFVATKKIGLLGHQRSHEKAKAEAKKPVVDPSVIPVAGSKKIESVFEMDSGDGIDGRKTDIPNGTDKDGVDWYGEGVQVENKSASQFGPGRTKGKAHFVG